MINYEQLRDDKRKAIKDIEKIISDLKSKYPDLSIRFNVTNFGFSSKNEPESISVYVSDPKLD